MADAELWGGGASRTEVEEEADAGLHDPSPSWGRRPTAPPGLTPRTAF